MKEVIKLQHLKRVMAKVNFYKLRIKKLENENKILWELIHELQKFLSIAAEIRKEERKALNEYLKKLS